MTEYHKIHSVFKRDSTKKGNPIIEGDFSRPEFRYLAGNSWSLSEKIDGTNIRIICSDGKIRFMGRTDGAQIPSALLNRLNDRFMPLVDFINEKFPNGAVLYGEGYGPKIQKIGHMYRDDQDFILFDVNVDGWWLDRTNLAEVASSLSLCIVPEIGIGTLWDAIAICKGRIHSKLIQPTISGGFHSQFGEFEAEGIIARPIVEMNTRSGERIITKIKCVDFKV